MDVDEERQLVVLDAEVLDAHVAQLVADLEGVDPPGTSSTRWMSSAFNTGRPNSQPLPSRPPTSEWRNRRSLSSMSLRSRSEVPTERRISTTRSDRSL